MKKYNAAIIGYGWVAGAHISAINVTPQAQVTAVCSSRPLDPAELSARHGGSITVYHDLEQVLANPDIHVVSICSYPWLHAGQVMAAAEAGKHLIIEKPLALNLKDVGAMRAAVEKAGVKTCVCFECRYASQFLATKAVIDAGWLGRIHYGEVDYYHGIGPWQLMSISAPIRKNLTTESPCFSPLASSQAGVRLNVSRLVCPRIKKPPGVNSEGSCPSSSRRCAKEVERRPRFFSPKGGSAMIKSNCRVVPANWAIARNTSCTRNSRPC